MIRQGICLILAFVCLQTSCLGREAKNTLAKLSTMDLMTLYESKDLVAQINQRLHLLAKNYPELVTTELLTKTKKSKQPIYLTKIGQGHKNILIVGAHHGREYVSSIATLSQIESLIDLAYHAPSPDIMHLLHAYTFYFIPILNPEGVNIALWIDAEWKANGSGVDLNRNYDTPTSPKQKGMKPSSSGYYGTHPFSEPETRAIKKLCEEKHFLTLLTYHSAGEVLFWEWGQEGDLLAESILLRDFIVEQTGYLPITSPYGWGLTDWFIETYKRPGFTPELGKTVNGKPLPAWELFKILNQHQTLPMDLVLEMERLNTMHYMDFINESLYHVINLYNTAFVPVNMYCKDKGILYREQEEALLLTYNGIKVVLKETHTKAELITQKNGEVHHEWYQMAMPPYKYLGDYYVERQLLDYLTTFIA